MSVRGFLDLMSGLVTVLMDFCDEAGQVAPEQAMQATRKEDPVYLYFMDDH